MACIFAGKRRLLCVCQRCAVGASTFGPCKRPFEGCKNVDAGQPHTPICVKLRQPLKFVSAQRVWGRDGIVWPTLVGLYRCQSISPHDLFKCAYFAPHQIFFHHESPLRMTTGFISPIFANNITITYTFTLTLGFEVSAAEFNLARLDSPFISSV